MQHKRCWLLLKGSEHREQRVLLISLSLVCRPEKSVQMHHGLFTGRFVSAELIAEDWGTLKVESLQILLKLWLKALCFGRRWRAWGSTAGGTASSSPPAALLMIPGPSGNCGGVVCFWLCISLDAENNSGASALCRKKLREVFWIQSGLLMMALFSSPLFIFLIPL